jgi:hypothetical protein
MSEAREAVVKLVMLGVVLAVLTLVARRSPSVQRVRSQVLWGLVATGALAYLNFGALHTDGTLLHVWDQFHYVLGAKYYPELGYDGLYVATLEARAEKDPSLTPPERIRDLRTSEVVPVASLDTLRAQVRARFSPARWEQFRADATRFYLRDEIFVDHGYLATPTHAAASRLVCGWLPFRHRALFLLAVLDFALLAGAGVLVYRAFGLETLAATSLMFGFGYCSRFFWFGGAFLRLDWLAALLAASAALKRRRMKWAGAALAYAACVRIFPIAVLVPLGVYAAAAYRRDGRARPWFECGASFLATALALVVAGGAAGRGLRAWAEFATTIGAHARMIAPNAIGLRVALSASLANLRGDLVDSRTLYEYPRIAADYALRGQERVGIIALAIGATVALALRAAWRARDPAVPIGCGIALVYALTTPSCYYGAFFVLLGLFRPVQTARLFLAVTAAMYLNVMVVFALAREGIIRLNGAAVYVPVSWLLLALLVEWLLRAGRTSEEDVLGAPGGEDAARGRNVY